MKEQLFTDKELKQLFRQIQQLPPKDRQRRKLLNKLIIKIQTEGRLKKFESYRNLPDFDELYADAMTDCLMYISTSIDKYDPEKAEVMAWVNQTLLFKFRTAFNKRYRNKIQPVFDEFKILNIPCLSQDSQDSYSLLRELIQNDPERILKNIKIKKHNISLQQIFLMLLDDKKWKEIALELHLSISTAQSFYSRSLEKPEVRNYFDKYLN